MSQRRQTHIMKTKTEHIKARDTIREEELMSSVLFVSLFDNHLAPKMGGIINLVEKNNCVFYHA